MINDLPHENTSPPLEDSCSVFEVNDTRHGASDMQVRSAPSYEPISVSMEDLLKWGREPGY
jgi:hypothetical protein